MRVEELRHSLDEAVIDGKYLRETEIQPLSQKHGRHKENPRSRGKRIVLWEKYGAVPARMGRVQMQKYNALARRT